MSRAADLHFYFDPVCPFAWMTSKWVRLVAEQRPMSVEWRPISLRLLNSHVDYDTHFPAGYEAGHTAGLRLLRVATRLRADLGPEAVGRFYEVVSGRIFDGPEVRQEVDAAGLDQRGTPAFLTPLLEQAGLPAASADALDDAGLDPEIQASTDEALTLTGKDVGTPILHVDPPSGTAFFGPVISRLPSPEAAVELWDHVLGLARFPGFAELKRSLRELPRLRGLGVEPDGEGPVEDWHAGSRRQKK